MAKTISIGKQDFASLREHDCFFVDKTKLIKEWWEAQDDITLITRPRRFGKTLNMSMLNCFFSNTYKNRGDLFEGLFIWEDAEYRKLQGTYPVLFLSFADVKQTNYENAIQKIKNIITKVYDQHDYLRNWEGLSQTEREQFASVTSGMSDVTAQDALKNITDYICRYYGKKVIILLDEYDTPMQEAYIHGYWKELTDFVRGLFNATFKTNSSLERAVMTGITRVTRESIFSGLNNLNVVTTTSDEYADCFGFTEEEVFHSLDSMEMGDKKEVVKQWYDGFSFGSHKDIYNPWSITNYLDKKVLRPYWSNTSSNGLVNKLIRTASADVKEQMEQLLQGKEIVVNFDEQVVFEQLEQEENAIFSLLVAGGYLKVENVEYRGITLEPWYHLSITNLETTSMFSNMFKGWFDSSQGSYGRFIKSFIQGDIEAMNYYMNKISMATFSYFDVGTVDGESEPERFYHGFVLGLMAEQEQYYDIRSNRESGFGRYDIMMIPKDRNNITYPAFVIEFKVHKPNQEANLEESVQSALKQITEKNYDAELLALGIPAKQIRHYGFAFEGKKVLIG